MLVIDQGSRKRRVLTPKAPSKPQPPTHSGPAKLAATQPQRAVPQLISEHGQGGGSSASDTGAKPTQHQTTTGYASQHSTQPTAVSELGRAGGSGSAGAGARPTAKQAGRVYATPGKPQKTVASGKGGKQSSPPRGTGSRGASNGNTRKPPQLSSTSKIHNRGEFSQKSIPHTFPLRDIPGYGKIMVTTQAFVSGSTPGGDRSLEISYQPHANNGAISAQGSVSFSDHGILNTAVLSYVQNTDAMGESYRSGESQTEPIGKTKMQVGLAGKTYYGTFDDVTFRATPTVTPDGPEVGVTASSTIQIKPLHRATTEIEFGVEASLSFEPTKRPPTGGVPEPHTVPLPKLTPEEITILLLTALGATFVVIGGRTVRILGGENR